MGQSVKAILQLTLIVGAVVGLCAWVISDRPDDAVWVTRFAAPAVALVAGFILFRAATRKDLAPDMLRDQFGSYFERDGLCFAPVVAVAEGRCFFNAYFQNRYSGACAAELIFQPGKKFIGRHNVPTVAFEVDCPGGAFGVVRIPYPVPGEYQGRQVSFDVVARTRYPAGAGKLLRFREGMRVGTPSSSSAAVAKTVGLLAVGVISYSKAANCTLMLPTGVAATNVGEAAMETEILWQPDLPTGGFPVGPPVATHGDGS